MDDLRPCPSCGGCHIRPQVDNGGECENCELYLVDWNKRPLEDALEAELAKYRGMEVGLAAVKNDLEWFLLSWRRHLDAIEEAARKLMPGEPCEDDRCLDCIEDRKLLDAIHAALAAFDMSPWRSVESAPMDGTVILGYTDEGLIRVVGFVGGMWKSDNLCGDDTYSADPDYWMPLPEDPEDDTNG